MARLVAGVGARAPARRRLGGEGGRGRIGKKEIKAGMLSTKKKKRKF